MDILAIIGAVAFSIGWVWLIVTGFQKGGVIWGIVIILFGWLGGLVFCIVKKTGWIPFALLFVGMIVAAVGLSPLIMKQLESFSR